MGRVHLTTAFPLRRPGQPNDLDGAVVFLASDASRYITGPDAAGRRRHLDRRDEGDGREEGVRTHGKACSWRGIRYTGR